MRGGLRLAVLAVIGGCSLIRGASPAPPGEMGVETPEAVVRAAPELPLSNSYRQALASGTRSEDGAPGAAAWRNTVSYRIEAELDPETAILRGHERIVYRNTSPAPLPSVVLNLYQNVFSEGVPRNRYVPITGGVALTAVSADGQSLARMPTNQIPIIGDPPTAPAGYSVQGTLARVRLPRPIAPGDSAVLVIEWEHAVPPMPSFRTAWDDALGSRVFQVAQWYPQIAMHDDLRGWDATPYLGDGEFYLPYGDFEVAITVPAGYLVGATGTLLNPEEVLTDEARSRLMAAMASDSITRVVTDADIPAENTTLHPISGSLTWRFASRNVRDFAFSTSAGYVWDATTVRMSDGTGGTRPVLVNALYRVGAPNWERAAAFAQHAMGVFGEYLIPYEYDQLTVAEGPIGGMEYPMLIFIGRPSAEESLYGVIAHEAAHQWFPMMVGSDEATNAWLDEGLATYLENRAAGDFYDLDDPFAADRSSYLFVAGTDDEVPLMRHTDLVTPYGARTVAAYSKPGVLLRSLEWILGPEAFRTALNRFASDWLGGNPAAWDFFSTFERSSGRDLSWFFAPWWFETEVFDQAIVNVEPMDSTGVMVTIESRGGIPAPSMLSAFTTGGGTISMIVGVEAWLDGARTVQVPLRAAGPIERIELDPGQIFPDVDRGNNVWTAGP